MKSIGIFLFFLITIYLSINYSNYKYNTDKVELTVEQVPISLSFYDFFNQEPLASKYANLFSKTEKELNLIHSKID
tara:strand:+ start:164 stop:391 length:228 start_codon:yes stop_codon:yes gene_type:complete